MQTFASRKKLRDSNKAHYTIKGTFKNPKTFDDFECLCTNKCHEKISAESRKKIFEKFWELGSYNCQTGFIAACLKETDVKRKREKLSEKRKYSRT